MKKLIAGLVLASFVLVGPGATFAQTSSTTASTQIQSLLTQIQNLQAQIKAMQDLQAQIRATQTNVTSTLTLIRSLREGMTGDDVSALQTILAADPTIYPQGVVSGFYGRLTSEAMKKFQKKYGIESVGYVGPKTLKKLNEVIKELGLSQVRDVVNSATSTTAIGQAGIAYKGNKFCIPPGHLIAKGWQKKNQLNPAIVTLCNDRYDDDDDGDIEIGRATPTLANTASASVVIGGSISDTVSLTGGQTPTGTITFSVFGPNDTTCATPLTPALPVVSVNGNGNYSSATFTTTAVGTYRFIASYFSMDRRNNPVRTACNATGSTVNVTAMDGILYPVIESVTATPAATTTVISWLTNAPQVPSTSTVWFSTISPLSLTSSTQVSDLTNTMNHSITLTGLATSTTYYFQVVSRSPIGATATSTQGSFSTLSGL